MEGSGDGGGGEEADVLKCGALGFWGAGDVEVCGAVVEDSGFEAFAHEEGEREDGEGQEQDGPLGPAPAFTADDEAADEGTGRINFSSMGEGDGMRRLTLSQSLAMAGSSRRPLG